ncbi:transcription antitermination factor NusG [Sphingomonas sp. PvP055]|uniref:transcription termination/antitermination protein NusG n=1 Tax=Sphingomonas sp. PvP055 TaxID=3156391 RepID=UPI003399007D
MSRKAARRREDTDWCILRTSGGRTLNLARSLAEAGFDVWTPQETLSRRVPRKKTVVDREVAILPTFVFARAVHIPELAAALALPVNPHPSFSIFRYLGDIPLLADREIKNLRDVEDAARLRELKKTRNVVPVGTTVTMTEGAFAGLSGVVKKSDGKFALVAFGGAFEVNIASFLIRTDGVQQA